MIALGLVPFVGAPPDRENVMNCAIETNWLGLFETNAKCSVQFTLEIEVINFILSEVQQGN